MIQGACCLTVNRNRDSPAGINEKRIHRKSNAALQVHTLEDKGQRCSLQAAGAVHQLKMEMRSVGISGIAEQSEFLAARHMFARVHDDASGDQVGIHGKMAIAHVDGDVIATDGREP